MPFNLKIFITLFLAMFVTTVGVGLVAPLLPLYAHQLGAGASQIGLIFGAFSLTRTIFVPYFGKLSDKRGKKPLLTIGLFLFFLLSLLYTLSKGVGALILLRLGQGFASAMVLPVAQAYVGTITPPDKEGRVMGLFNISLYGGLSIGPVLGGVVKDWLNIQASFLTMGALSLLGLTLCVLLLPAETPSQATQTADTARAASYMALVRMPLVMSLFAFRACFTTCIGVIWTFLPFLAGTELGLSSTAIGLVVMMNVLVAGLLQAPMGYMADRFNKKLLVTAGGILAIFSFLYLSKAASLGDLLISNGLLGLAGGISFPAIMALGVIEGRKNKAMGSLMGLLAMGHSLGMLIGPLLAGVIIDLFSISVMFILATFILSAGTLIFARYQWA